jgi:hypothetical protein
MSSFVSGPGEFNTSSDNAPTITIKGLSTDTKPSATVYAGYLFQETNTGNTYAAYGGAWNLISAAGGSGGWSPSKAEPITNKDLTSGTNTFPTSLATLAGSQVITNKTVDFDTNTVINRGPYTHYIYKAGNTYKAHNTATGLVDFSGATLDPVLSSVLNAYNILTSGQFGYISGGGVYVQSGAHTLSGSFAGWNVPPWTRIYSEPNCFIQLPSGYNSYVFGLFETNGGAGTNSNQDVIIDGFYIRENGTNQHLWDGLLLNPGGGGTGNTGNPSIAFCWFQNLTISGANNAVHLKVGSAAGWANGNVFRNFSINNPVTGVLFDYGGQTPTAGNGFHRNMFQSIQGQAGGNTTAGFKDIHGKVNTFVDAKMWDMSQFGHPEGVTANITANATSTIIIGGIMTSQNFSDLGVSTWILDDVSGFKPSNFDGNVYPSHGRKWGMYQGASTGGGTGLFAGGMSTLGSAIGAGFDTTDGTYGKWNTGGNTGNNGGVYYANAFTMRNWNPYAKFKFKFSQSTNNRAFVGLTSAPSNGMGGGTDEPLTNLSGIGILQRAADTQFQNVSNISANASSTIAASATPVNVGTTLHTLEIHGRSATNDFTLQLDNNPVEIITATIPAATTALGIQCCIQQSATEAAHSVLVFLIEVGSDK